MMKNRAGIGSYVELHILVVLFGFTAILGKLIKISALELVFFRTFLASIGLFLVLKFLKKPIKITHKDLLKLLCIGIVVFFHWFLFFYAARISNVSVSLVGLATSTLWVALLSPLFGKGAISIVEICLGLVMVLGLYIIFQANINNWFGLILSIGSGFVQAVFSHFNAQFTQKHHSFVITFYEMVGACIATSGIILLNADPSIFNGNIPSVSDFFYLIILAFVCTVYAYSAVVRLLKHISPFSVNLAINLEPVYGIILAYFIFGETEKMTFSFYLGTLIICIGVFGYQIFSRKMQKTEI